MNISDFLRRLPLSSIILLVALVIIVVVLVIFIPKSKPEPPKVTKRDRKPGVEKPEPVAEPVGRIAIIIDDFGYNYDGVAQAYLELDANLTYAIIPGHAYSQQIAKEAAGKGYETIIHMPMESLADLNGEDDYMLKTTMSTAELERRLKLVLEEYPFTKGMNNHQGSRATQDQRVMAIVGASLKAAGKYFIDSRTTAQSIAERECAALGVPVARRNVFLDNDLDPALIHTQIGKLAAYAAKYGEAVGIGHNKRSTLAVLRQEIPRLKAAGYEFVFASELVN